jgi:hypothetical protein
MPPNNNSCPDIEFQAADPDEGPSEDSWVICVAGLEGLEDNEALPIQVLLAIVE